MVSLAEMISYLIRVVVYKHMCYYFNLIGTTIVKASQNNCVNGALYKNYSIKQKCRSCFLCNPRTSGVICDCFRRCCGMQTHEHGVYSRTPSVFTNTECIHEHRVYSRTPSVFTNTACVSAELRYALLVKSNMATLYDRSS